MAKGGKVGQVAVWVLLAMLIVGLAGFGITGFGTSMRGIGKVGEVEIDARDYARNIQQEVNALSAQAGRPLGFAEAQMLGVDRNVLEQLVTTAAFDDLAASLGVSVGDERLAREIRALPAFRGIDGNFDREAYRFALDRNDLTEAEFEARMRADIARGLLQGAIAGQFDLPEVYASTLHAYATERRAFDLLVLGDADLNAPLPEPDAAALRAHYDANPERYTAPELRRIRHATLMPEALVPEMSVSDEALRGAYADRIDEYVIAERRLVERLVFVDRAAAEAAAAEIAAGRQTLDDLIAARGLAPADVDLGDVAAADLGAAGEGVFAAAVGGVVGPLESPLGPALFRVNGVLGAQETTFEEVREQLFAELALDAARRAIAARVEEVEDMLAGGATLDELAERMGMTLGTVDLGPETREGLAAYPAFRDKAAELEPGGFPERVELDDGGMVVLELTEIVPPTLRPFDAVGDEVRAAVRAEARRDALIARRDAILAEVRAGAPLGAFGIVTVNPGITRDGFIEGAPGDLIARLFALEPGAAEPVDGDDFVAILVPGALIPSDPETADAAAIRAALAERAGQEMAQDAFALVARHLQNRTEIRLNQTAIEAINAQLR
ncbi:MAG: hypothetical protein RLZ26_494 [Pseudomonadota bacterium]|jgi:peptidyl-prolyl cis-trans isomerase D